MNMPISSKDLINCLLCYDAKCSKACPNNNDPAKIIRSLYFKNYIGALKELNYSCANCKGMCQENCIISPNVRIKPILEKCYKAKETYEMDYKKTDISTNICGIKIENPFLLSSSVVSSSYDMCKRAFEAGWAGAAFKTISMIDIHEASPRFSAIKNLDGSFLAFKNIEQLSDHSVMENLEIFKRLKKDFPNNFLLVSLMGRNNEEWEYLAKESEKAGADALELNFSCPNMTTNNTGSSVGQIPELVEEYTRAVVNAVKIPVIAKLTPNVATMSEVALAAKRGGAKGIAAINTIESITEFDIINNAFLKKKENIAIGGLSGHAVLPIALRFISELSRNKNLKDMHLSAMGGIKTYEDAIMFLILGASSIQITTAVMEFGYRIIEDLIDGLSYFLGRINMTLEELIGSGIKNVVEISKIERDYIIYPKFLHQNCVGCKRCFISCRDGGHQAISFDGDKPTLDPKKCVGCHLCILVCPTNAIISSNNPIKKEK